MSKVFRYALCALAMTTFVGSVCYARRGGKAGGKLTRLRSERTGITRERDVLRARIKEITVEIATHNATAGKLRGESGRLSARLRSEGTLSDTEAEKMRSKIASIASEVSTHEAEAATLKGDRRKLRTAVTAKNEEVSEKDDEIEREEEVEVTVAE